jgi:hypothetical protein
MDGWMVGWMPGRRAAGGGRRAAGGGRGAAGGGRRAAGGGRKDRRTDGRSGRQVVRWVDGWMVGQMGGWVVRTYIAGKTEAWQILLDNIL